MMWFSIPTYTAISVSDGGHVAAAAQYIKKMLTNPDCFGTDLMFKVMSESGGQSV